jgi:hypothetical protein
MLSAEFDPCTLLTPLNESLPTEVPELPTAVPVPTAMAPI